MTALATLRPRMVVPIHWGSLRIPVLWRLRPRLFTDAGVVFAEHARGVERVIVVVSAVPIPGRHG